MMKLHKDGDKVFDDIIGDHEEKEKNNVGEAEQDLVDVLLRIQKDNDFEIPLSLENIKAVLKDVFFCWNRNNSNYNKLDHVRIAQRPRGYERGTNGGKNSLWKQRIRG
ncbi:cytochrome P450 71D8-like [Neltuma alba]|uniref:cytochrome P450 71D8-like n=1 Tax=Neltuma alba TaxID=207710 RepID=UPI0010A555F3|nr:cytochrome P450 71D8-like [Prosopis alba]